MVGVVGIATQLISTGRHHTSSHPTDIVRNRPLVGGSR
jgi:hypothetical protein